jgi:hypothetical protein
MNDQITTSQQTQGAVVIGSSAVLGIVDSSKPLSLPTNGNPITVRADVMNVLNTLTINRRTPVHNGNRITV